jgi:ABC-type branched-subunit amino acid transport system ATPase component
MLEVRDVSVAYGHRRALEDVSLRVAEGEIVTLLGANGSGKSTMLRAISGLVRAQRGRILFRGESARIASSPPASATFPRAARSSSTSACARTSWSAPTSSRAVS